MNASGDAAEQVVRLSLEGFEVAAKLTGAAAKNIAILLISALKEEGKTKGKTRLTNMIKSGKELTVFSIPQKDLKKFTEHAKKYGVLYNVLREKFNKDPNAQVDIIARTEDASKIQRIVDRFEIGKVDKAAIVAEAQKDISERKEKEIDKPTKSQGEKIVEQVVDKAKQKEENANENPFASKTSNENPLKKNSNRKNDLFTEGRTKSPEDRPSVKEKLDNYKEAARKQKIKLKTSLNKKLKQSIQR